MSETKTKTINRAFWKNYNVTDLIVSSYGFLVFKFRFSLIFLIFFENVSCRAFSLHGWRRAVKIVRDGNCTGSGRLMGGDGYPVYDMNHFIIITLLLAGVVDFNENCTLVFTTAARK